MSAYFLARAIYRLHNPEERRRFLENANHYLRQDPDLTEEERRWIRDGDFGAIYRAGVSMYVMRKLGFTLGTDFLDMAEQTGGVVSDELRMLSRVHPTAKQQMGS